MLPGKSVAESLVVWWKVMGGDCFNKRLVRERYPHERPLRTDEIQVKNENIRYAIRVLDDFFDGRTHTMVS